MPNGWQWVIKRGENSLTLSHLNNIRFGCEDALMRILKAKPKKILDFLRGPSFEVTKLSRQKPNCYRQQNGVIMMILTFLASQKTTELKSRDDENSKRLTFYPPFALAKDSSLGWKKIKQKIHTKCALKWPPVGINLDTLHTTATTPIWVVKLENVIFGMHFVFAIKYVYLLAIKYVTKHLTSRICLSTVLFDNCNFENTCVSMRKIALNLVGKTNSWLKA